MIGAQGMEDPWQVRILPKIYWGVHPVGLDGMAPTEPRVGVLHHFLGSWKVKGGWRKRRFSLRAVGARVSALFSRTRRRYG